MSNRCDPLTIIQFWCPECDRWLNSEGDIHGEVDHQGNPVAPDRWRASLNREGVWAYFDEAPDEDRLNILVRHGIHGDAGCPRCRKRFPHCLVGEAVPEHQIPERQDLECI